MNLKKLIAYLLLISVSLCTLSCIKAAEDKKTLVWIEEKSYFNGYRLTDDGTVIFDYAICFHNYTDDDFEISLQAQFKKVSLNRGSNTKSFMKVKTTAKCIV